MKNVIKLCMVVMMMFSISCSNEPITEIINASQDDANLSRTMQSSVAILEKPGDVIMEIPGASSTLHRSKNGLTVNFSTNGLIPGNAYTMWWVIFGDAPGPPILVTYAAGHIVGGSGTGNFSSHLSVGEIFNTPLTAEVHLVLRSHGPAQPEMMPDQIQTINGGCTSGFPSGPILRPDSDVVGYCGNIQVAIHPKVVN